MTHSSIGRARSIPLVVAWLVLWIIIIATWIYDEQGFSSGMPGPVFLVMMLGPLLVGVLLGWGRTDLGSAAKAGMIGGVVYGLANMGAQLLWGGVLRLLDRIDPDAMAEMGGVGFFIGEVVEFTVLFTVTGLVLGLAGALTGAALSRATNRRQRSTRMQWPYS